MLDEDLRNYQRQFHAIEADARDLCSDLTEAQSQWRPSPNQWSIAHCLDHILVSGRSSLSNLRLAIDEARSNNVLSRGPFRYGVIERWFVRQTEPPPRFRMKAPRAYQPRLDLPFPQLLSGFFALQEEFLACVEEADGIHLSKVKVANPVSKWIRFSLGQEIALNAAHERRHLWQARRVKEDRRFPRPASAI